MEWLLRDGQPSFFTKNILKYGKRLRIFDCMKAKPIDKARVVKSWRLNPDVLKKLTAFVKRKENKLSESEIVEAALYDYISR